MCCGTTVLLPPPHPPTHPPGDEAVRLPAGDHQHEEAEAEGRLVLRLQVPAVRGPGGGRHPGIGHALRAVLILILLLARRTRRTRRTRRGRGAAGGPAGSRRRLVVPDLRAQGGGGGGGGREYRTSGLPAGAKHKHENLGLNPSDQRQGGGQARGLLPGEDGRHQPGRPGGLGRNPGEAKLLHQLHLPKDPTRHVACKVDDTYGCQNRLMRLGHKGVAQLGQCSNRFMLLMPKQNLHSFYCPTGLLSLRGVTNSTLNMVMEHAINNTT